MRSCRGPFLLSKPVGELLDMTDAWVLNLAARDLFYGAFRDTGTLCDLFVGQV